LEQRIANLIRCYPPKPWPSVIVERQVRVGRIWDEIGRHHSPSTCWLGFHFIVHGPEIFEIPPEAIVEIELVVEHEVHILESVDRPWCGVDRKQQRRGRRRVDNLEIGIHWDREDAPLLPLESRFRSVTIAPNLSAAASFENDVTLFPHIPLRLESPARGNLNDIHSRFVVRSNNLDVSAFASKARPIGTWQITRVSDANPNENGNTFLFLESLPSSCQATVVTGSSTLAIGVPSGSLIARRFLVSRFV